MSFQQKLQERLSFVTRDTIFDVHNLCSKQRRSSPLIKNIDNDTFLRHRLILLSVPTIGFICGLEAYEYALASSDGKVQQRIVYIAKVDTTSAISIKGVTSNLVLAYLESLPPQSSVFVFARAQPQYLFAKSARNPAKSVLRDRDLVFWWLRLLNKISIKSTGWWTVPGIEDESSALIEVGARKRIWKPSDNTTWDFGTNYYNVLNRDCIKDAQAADVIPHFEDDAKSRFLKDHTDAKLSVSEFWDLLAFTEECGSGKIVGFFKLKLSGSETETETVQEENKEESTDDFTEFWNTLMSLDFCDSESVLASTHTAIQEIEKRFDKEHHHFQFEVKAKEQKTPVESTKRTNVNTLSPSLFKRKKM